MKTLLWLLVCLGGMAVMVLSTYHNNTAGYVFGALTMVLGGVMCALETGR